MAEQTPFYQTVVEPTYDALPQYNVVEDEGIDPKMLFGVLSYIISVIAIIIIITFVYVGQIQRQQETIVGLNAPYTELVNQEMHAKEMLNEYKVVDTNAGKYRVPLDVVMKKMADQGRVDAAAASKVVEEAKAITPVATPAPAKPTVH